MQRFTKSYSVWKAAITSCICGNYWFIHIFGRAHGSNQKGRSLKQILQVRYMRH